MRTSWYAPFRKFIATFCAAAVLVYGVPIVTRAQQAPRLPFSSVQMNVDCPMGIQVNTFNGNLYYSRNDLSIPGRGLSLEITLAYNSGLSNTNNGFGFGWQLSYDTYYKKNGADVTIYRGDGRVDNYVWSSGTSSFTRPPGVRDTLEEYQTDQYRLTAPQGTETYFDAPSHKKATRIEDPNGNTVSLAYNASDQLASITDPSGRSLNLSYASGRLSTITDPNTTPNRVIQLAYASFGNLTSITDVGGNTTAYGYSNHLLTSITDPLGNTATITYENDTIISAVVNVSTATTSKSLVYDTAARTTTVTDVVNGADQVTEYVYDTNNKISSIVDALGNSKSMTWDSENHLTSVTDENSHTTSYTYDANGNVLTVTDPLNHTTTYTYDSTFNKVASVQDANGHTTAFEYDAAGNLVKVTDPLNNETIHAYDANGNLTSTTDANNHTTVFGYNSQGNLTSVVDPLGVTVLSSTYDTVSNLLAATDGNGNTTTFAYDALGRPISLTNPLGDETQLIYNANGNRTGTTDAENHTTGFSYDELNRLAMVTDALGGETRYTYDEKGNLTSILNAEGHTTTFTYDAANRLTAEADPLSNTKTFSYDNAGNFTTRVDANGQTTAYTYDAADQLTAIDYPGSNDASFNYDNVGNVVTLSNADVSETRGYDAMNRLVNSSAVTPAFSKAVGYTYDPVGNRATMTDPDGGVTTYTYDSADRLVSLTNPSLHTTGFAYDSGGRQIRKDHANGTYALYAYDEADNLLSLVHKNSQDTSLFSYAYLYDKVGNRTRMTEVDESQTGYGYDSLYQLADVDFPDATTAVYTYDSLGNRMQLVDSSGTINYAYDSADRLLSAGSNSYAWDDNGNQTGKTEGAETTTYMYDGENRLTDIAFPDSSTNEIAYYPDGRRLSLTESSGVPAYYLYDGANVLVEADENGNASSRYTSGLGFDKWLSMDRTSASYFYHDDALGSIVGLSDMAEAAANTYRYTPFGKADSQTESITNPLRFTGREYDSESGLYFYRARYYDCEVGRFSAQDPFSGFPEIPLSLNRHSYTQNNPVNHVDPTGEFPIIGRFVDFAIGLTGFAIGFAIGFGVDVFIGIIDIIDLVLTPPEILWGNNDGDQGGGGSDGGKRSAVTLSTFTAIGLEDLITPPWQQKKQTEPVLLQWQTGYEVDNLGFHIYRDQHGDLIRLTPSPIAGSALMVGAGTTLTAGHSYTWWDTPPRAATAQYWLEDIDLNGESTWHGPVAPVPYNPELDETYLDLALDLAGPPAKASPLLTRLTHQRTRPSDGSEVVERTAGAPTARSSQMTDQWAVAGAPAIKIAIQEEGWYRIEQADLIAAGLDPNVDPRNLRLFVEGSEQAILVLGEEDASLDPGDAVELYAFGLETPWSGSHTYWLAEGSQPGLRVELAAEPQPSGDAGPTFAQTIELAEHYLYSSSIKNGDAENFFGELLPPWKDVDQALTVQHLDAGAAEMAVLEVALQGVTTKSHKVAVELNGIPLGDVLFQNRDNEVTQWQVPHSDLQEGQNLVTLTAKRSGSYSLVDYIRLTYQHTHHADDNALRFTAQPWERVVVEGFSDAGVRVFDVTDPAATQRLPATITNTGPGEYSLEVTPTGSGQRSLLAVAADRILEPASLTSNQPSDWNLSSHQADLVILGHGSLLAGAEALRDRRESQGWQVAMVDIQDVYDEFNFGLKSPYAVRDFLTHAAASWSLPPGYLLLLGDATLDPRDYRNSGRVDLVPTKTVVTEVFETASDDWFGDLDGDGLTELAVGRLPVRSLADTTAVIAKLIAYEETDPGESWTREALLVADDHLDNADDTLSFETASTSLETFLPEPMNTTKIFLGQSSTATARAELLDQLNEGQVLVNYLGHGSVETWASERLLRTSDVAGLTNGPRLPFVITMNCVNGYFSSIFENSLAAALVTAEAGGAAAVWASSGLTTSGKQVILNQRLVHELFSGQAPTLGQATLAAKAAVDDPELRSTWILFGDPTMQLRGNGQ